MGAPQFTPGPWIVHPSIARVDCQTLSEKGGLLPVCQMLWPTEERTEDETEANARLIASAPELYEAAVELDAMWAEDFKRPGEIDEPRLLAPETLAVWRKFIAALAKARGEQ